MCVFLSLRLLPYVLYAILARAGRFGAIYAAGTSDPLRESIGATVLDRDRRPNALTVADALLAITRSPTHGVGTQVAAALYRVKEPAVVVSARSGREVGTPA
jgi:hypothetical protein